MKELIQNNKSIYQFIKFIIIGILNTLITLAIIFILSKIFFIDYRISNAIGYTAGFINSFLWNKIWTFKSNKNVFIEIIMFLLIFTICYFANFFLLIFLVEKCKFNKDISQLLGMGLYTILNFLGNKYYTFNQKKM